MNVPEISGEELRALTHKDPTGLMLVDVRTPGEYEQGHLANAINIDFLDKNFDKRINELPRDKKIVLYCKSGRRSENALKMMIDKGFKNVSHLKGGFDKF